MLLEEGDPAPEIAAENQDCKVVDPAFDEPTVLYFYPKDDTPGCSVEARQFQAELESYREAGIAVYGVSMDDAASHHDFCDSEDLQFDLLADPDGDVAEAFGVDMMEVRGATVTNRTTFVLADGEVRAVYAGVDPDGHARAVLEDLLDRGVVALPE
jgi:peroxiredoxin Q/BCP